MWITTASYKLLLASLSQKMAGRIAGRVCFRFSLQLWGMLCQNHINDRGETTGSVCLQSRFFFFPFFLFLILFKLPKAFVFQLRTQARWPESAIAFGCKIKEFLKKVLKDFLSNMKQVPELSLKVYILPSFHAYNLWIICQKKSEINLVIQR